MASKSATVARPVAQLALHSWVMWLCASGVALLTLLALFVRLKDLTIPTVSLSIDEARLALVAQGIQDHGWPLLPSGKVYTRGLPAALSMVPGLDLLGRT